MKKFIALILVLVMVLSLSTVAFAERQRGYSLATDTVNGVISVVNCIFKTGYSYFYFDFSGTFGGLANAVIDYHNEVVEGITGAIRQMADYIGDSNCIASRAACCVECMAGVFHYVYIIGAQF